MPTTMTLRLEPELKGRLEQLSKATHRSKTYLAAEAIRELIEINEWQVQEIQSALQEADNKEFASNKALAKTLAKWGAAAD